MEWALPAISVIVLGYAAVSRRLDGTSITAPMVFTGAGLVLGAKAAGLIEPSPGGESVKLLASATLAVVLFGDAARIDFRALREEYRVPARLLGIGLPLTIVAGFGAALALFGSLPWPEALVLAVVLAPTDAALGQSVVTLPSLPSLIRQGLNVESGLNDGLCVPIFYIAVAVASAEAPTPGAPHAGKIVAEEIGWGVVAGAGAGALAAAILLLSVRRGLVDPLWLQVVPVAAAALAYTTATALGGSGFIAAFVGGMLFGGLRRRVGGEVGYLLEQLGALLGAATFIVFGAAFLEPALGGITWSVAAYALLSLTVVRIVPVGIAMLGTGARPQTLGFLGWFGPRGLASIVFAVLIVEQNGQLPHENLLLTTVYATVGLSVLLHGVTAAPLARRYAAWYSGRGRSGVEAAESAHRVQWRTNLGASSLREDGARPSGF
jgi:sodium/hydrogen antiporter